MPDGGNEVMSAMIRFGTDGWRARRDGEFTEDNVIRVADAAARLWAQANPGAIVYVGFDTRNGAEHFARLAARVIAGHGLVVKLSDRYTPTPALSWTIAHDARCCGGLMVTGSHHPADYLGIKFRVADGGAGSSEFVSEVERAIGSEPTDLRGPIDIVDFKSERKPDVNRDYELLETYRKQLHLYAHLIEGRTGRPVGKMRIYYTGEESGNPEISFNHDRRSIEAVAAEFDEVAHKIMQRDFSCRAANAKLCENCDFRYYCKN